MKKLWLSAITAACLLAGTAAHAGDHGRGGHDNGWHRGWDNHREYRHCDDDRWERRHYSRGYEHDYYRPVVYSRPVYYSRPAYYGRPSYGRYYDDDIHGSISVNF